MTGMLPCSTCLSSRLLVFIDTHFQLVLWQSELGHLSHDILFGTILGYGHECSVLCTFWQFCLLPHVCSGPRQRLNERKFAADCSRVVVAWPKPSGVGSGVLLVSPGTTVWRNVCVCWKRWCCIGHTGHTGFSPKCTNHPLVEKALW